MKASNNVYHRFIEFEEKAASIYLRLASHFSSDRELSWFWFGMAIEEKQHAGLLQFCVQEELFAPDLPTHSEVERMDRLFKDLERRAADKKLTLEESFSLAIELETSEVNAIYCHLTKALHNSPYLLKRKIATVVPNHIDGLVAAACRFGVGDEILKQANRLRNNCAQDSDSADARRPESQLGGRL